MELDLNQLLPGKCLWVMEKGHLTEDLWSTKVYTLTSKHVKIVLY